MERRVIKGFTDKDTKAKFPVGSKFVSEDKERVNDLVNKGHLSGEEIKTLKEAQEELETKQDNEDSQEVPTNVEGKLEDKTVEELKKDIEAKGLEVVGTGKNGAIKKEDYIKALKA